MPNDELLWGPYSLPASAATQHFLVSGTTGSGKTTLIDGLLRSVFESSTNQRCRAIIYDAKQEVIPKLNELGLESRVRFLDPFDSRCSPWDLATDISDLLSAHQLAHILIPESDSGQSGSDFFDAACRDIIAATALTFSLCASEGQWTFRDLILALLYPDHAEALFALKMTRKQKPFPVGQRIWSAYLDPETTDSRTLSNIRASLNANISIFEPVAAAWARAVKPPFSLKQWQERNSNEILVLGNDEAARAAIDPINRALVQRAVELTLARPEGQSSPTWFFLDEVREAGKLHSLNPLLLKGRSKGACVVLSFQDIEGLRDVYGDHLANEIVANCTNVGLLRTSSATTAEWAAQMFGNFFVTDRDKTHGTSGSDISASETQRVVERSALLSGDLLYLPLPSDSTGLVGFFRDAKATANEPKKYKIEWAEVNKNRLRGMGLAVVPMRRDELFLEKWTAEDFKRLEIAPAPPQPKISSSSHTAQREAPVNKRTQE